MKNILLPMFVSMAFLASVPACTDIVEQPPEEELNPDAGIDEEEEEQPIDADGDGYKDDVDCNDGDAAVSPGATEICDGIDNDCDNKLDDQDDGVTGQAEYWPDFDADGEGKHAAPTITSCAAPANYVANDADCYDDNAKAYTQQAAFFATHRGDGSFDYNCSGTEKKEFTETGGCMMLADNSCGVVPGWEDDSSPACGKTAQWVSKCKKIYLGNGYTCKVDGTISQVQRCR